MIVVAKKRKAARQKRRQNFLRKMKQFAVALYWFASFTLVILEIYEILKNW